jgi:hypothetical protein
MVPTNGPAVFVQQWETTITGAPATGDGNDVYVDAINPLAGGNMSAVGIFSAVDPTSGNLVLIGGNGNSSGQLTADEITRLGFAADGFLVRVDRSGNLVNALPVVSTQTLSYMNTPLDVGRVANFSLRIDHQGNAYVGAIACCDATTGMNPNPYGISGLTLKKINPSGTIIWDQSLASPDDIALFSPSSSLPNYQTTPAIAVDSSNNLYVTYSRIDPNSPPLSGLFVSKIAADTQQISLVGGINYTVVTYLASQSQMGISSFFDDNNVLYVPYAAAAVEQLVGLSTTSSPILSPVGTTMDSTVFGNADHAFQVDPSGVIFQQQTTTSSTDSYQHNVQYSVVLSKYQF